MNWKDKLRDSGVLIADGAWGTELAKRGLRPGDVPELLNADSPDVVEAVARSYVEAGADIVLSNTFGGNRFKLDKSGLGGRAAELNRAGTEISVRAADGGALVFASIGPTGEFMAPLGTKTEEEFVACFTEQIGACIEGGADGICIETMMELKEVLAALSAARSLGSFPVVASLTFDRGARGFATVMGITPEDAAAQFDAAGADIIGSNCGSGIENYIEIVSLLRTATKRPLWVKPNAGVPRLVDGKTVFLESPEKMAGDVRHLIEGGANFIGGCCGTTPEHIRQIAAAARDNADFARSVNRPILEAL